MSPTEKEFVEVTIAANCDSGDLLGMLESGLALGSWEEEGAVHVYWPAEAWDQAALQDLQKALEHLGLPDADIRVDRVADQDWNARWTASVKPIRIGARFRICQSWTSPDPTFAGFEIVIDPKRAFGSGYHATTQLLLEWVGTVIRGGERVLDVGTGTGILAMGVLRLGAASALGIDNDPVAIECARENASANGFGGELELRVAGFEELTPETFDLALANLDRRTLLALAPLFATHLGPGGRAIISGIQPEDHDEICQAFSGCGGRLGESRRLEEWLAVEFLF
jgi:ribosomal protein L11 methyltransferase